MTKHYFPLDGRLLRTPFKVHLLVNAHDIPEDQKHGNMGPIKNITISLNSPAYGFEKDEASFDSLPDAWRQGIIFKLGRAIIREQSLERDPDRVTDLSMIHHFLMVRDQFVLSGYKEVGVDLGEEDVDGASARPPSPYPYIEQARFAHMLSLDDTMDEADSENPSDNEETDGRALYEIPAMQKSGVHIATQHLIENHHLVLKDGDVKETTGQGKPEVVRPQSLPIDITHPLARWVEIPDAGT